MKIPMVVHSIGTHPSTTKGEVLGEPQGVVIANAVEVVLTHAPAEHGAVQHGTWTLRFWRPSEIEKAWKTYKEGATVDVYLPEPPEAPAAAAAEAEPDQAAA